MKKLYLLSFLTTVSIGLNAQTTDRIPLVEGFSSNTCGPCASWNASYTPILDANDPNTGNYASVAVLKYQMDWPTPGTDPSNNDDADVRRSYYGVSGIPDWFIDGEFNNGSQTTIDEAKNNVAPMIIDAAYILTGNTIDVTVEITPLQDLGNGSRIFIALANKSYNYSGGTNGESQFKHVFRKMLPAANGAFVPTLVANQKQTFNESYTYTVSGLPAQTNNDFWNANFEVVVWVQRTNTKEVWNAAVATEGTIGIEEGDNDQFGLIVYPNPANEQTTVMFDGNGSEDVTIEVYNSLGQVVVSENRNDLIGRQRIDMNTSDLPAGMYQVHVKQGDKLATSQLMVSK